LHRTANATDSVSASKTPLRSNVFTNESNYDEEPGGLASSRSHSSASHTSQGEDEVVPEEINTSHGSTNCSSEGHTQGTGGVLHRSDQRSNIPSVVSQTPEDHPASNRRSSQQTIASRTSSRLTKGSRKDRRMNL
jgi:hypothetical protein